VRIMRRFTSVRERHIAVGQPRRSSAGDDRRVTTPDDVSAFGHDFAAVLSLVLADGFVGAYFVGSIALGGYVRGESDIDIVAVCDKEVDEATRQAVVEKVLEVTANCPARGLEFTRTGRELRRLPVRTPASSSMSTADRGCHDRYTCRRTINRASGTSSTERSLTAMASPSPGLLGEKHLLTSPQACCWR